MALLIVMIGNGFINCDDWQLALLIGFINCDGLAIGFINCDDWIGNWIY